MIKAYRIYFSFSLKHSTLKNKIDHENVNPCSFFKIIKYLSVILITI